MKKISSNLLIILLFLIFLLAPIGDGSRFLLISLVPLILAIKNAVILRDQVLYNIKNKKYSYIEKKFGKKRAFIAYSVLLVIIPLLFAVFFVISGLRLL